MAIDPVLIGSTATGILALLAQAVSKLKCYVACRRDDEEYCEPQFACGFLDSNLGDIITPHKKNDDETPRS